MKRKLGEDQFRLMASGEAKISKWSDESLIEGFQSKFDCGSKAYEEERKKRRLPSSRTLREKLQPLRLESGTLKEIIKLLKKKVSAMNDLNKDCVIVFDEMAIQPGVNYCNNLKQYIGDVTLPQHSGTANHLLVFMAVGLRERWKQVVAYYFSSDIINNGCLKDILFGLVEDLESIGLRVHAAISDCGGN